MKVSSNQKLIRVATLLFLDAIALVCAEYISLIMYHNFDFKLVFGGGLTDTVNLSLFLPIVVLVTLAVFALFRIYESLWQFASIHEYMLIIVASMISYIVSTSARLGFSLHTHLTCYVMSFMVFTSFAIAIRLMYRILRMAKAKRGAAENSTRILLIGAGDAADILIREFKSDPTKKVVAVIDDDPGKKGTFFSGVKVIGSRYRIPDTVEKYDVTEIIFAIPSASASDKSDILNICKKTRCALKTLPGISDIISHGVSSTTVVDVDVDDFLGREPIQTNVESIIDYVKDKVIIVTGGGGSIGSELCRQIASHSPKKLIIFDIYENNAYDIQNELKTDYPELDLLTLIGSVRDSGRLNWIFSAYKPDIVFHAAAHKHVPLMEDSPLEAVKNNVFGTLATVQAADANDVKRFILISTDKAVRPTNVMGATKRICEMIVQTWDKKSKTEFVAVRFGNVLGSNGSVIPLFKKQIAAGGPVTVTDPNITRFFMTIKEAVGLVLRAGAMAKGGEIFILDMGSPVKILDLAESIIRLSGHTPYTDIDIKFTGLRPGEKLYEEILMHEEGLSSTEDKLIHIGKPLQFDTAEFLSQLDNLRVAAFAEGSDIKSEICKIVPITDNEHLN